MEKEIIEFRDRVMATCEAINGIGRLYNGQKNGDLGVVKLVSLDLLQRINANLELCGHILNVLENGYNQKIPLALLIRACLSDSIVGLYLLGHDEKYFKEELDVLNLGFVKYLRDLLPLEVEFYNRMKGENNPYQPEFDGRFEIFRNYLRSNKGEPWIVKSRGEFREIGNNEELTPQFMCEFLKQFKEMETLSYMFNFYRYFSQYEHYTFTGRHIVRQEFEADFLHIKSALIMVIHSVLLLTSALDMVTEDMREPIKKALDLIPQEHPS